MKTYTLLALLCLIAAPAWASHFLGGQIQAKNMSGNTYQITVVLFMDEGNAASDQTNSVPVCLGDGSTVSAVRAARRIIGQNISVNTYQFTHTYNGPGVFRITTSMANRTPMVNLSQANQSIFSLSTTIQNNGNLRNATSIFEPSPELWQVGVNQRATLSLRAVDADGDSLSYALIKPITNSLSTACTTPFAVEEYVFPNAVSSKGTYKLNAQTGELIWDAPTTTGQYAASILVREWRNGIQIGESYVETVIRVQDKAGSPSPIPPYEPAAETPSLVTGIETDTEPELTLTVSPNPVQSQLMARIRATKSTTATLQLLNLTGQIVAEKALNRPDTTHEITFSVENLPSGLYVLKANVNGQIISQKIIKQ